MEMGAVTRVLVRVGKNSGAITTSSEAPGGVRWQLGGVQYIQGVWWPLGGVQWHLEEFGRNWEK